MRVGKSTSQIFYEVIWPINGKNVHIIINFCITKFSVIVLDNVCRTAYKDEIESKQWIAWPQMKENTISKHQTKINLRVL